MYSGTVTVVNTEDKHGVNNSSLDIETYVFVSLN